MQPESSRTNHKSVLKEKETNSGEHKGSSYKEELSESMGHNILDESFDYKN